MAAFAIIVYAFALVLAVIIVWMLTRRRRRVELPPHLGPVIAAARRRALVAVLFAVVIFITTVVAGIGLPSLLGIPIAVAPLVAAAAGCLLYSATPPRDVALDPRRPRAAALARRSWITVIPLGWLRASVEIALIFVGIIVFCGLTAAPDDLGRARAVSFETASRASSASPYPGWFYGIPALIALLLLIVATVVALQRVGSTAAFPDAEDQDADRQWRRASASVVLGLTAGAMLFSLGGFALIAGRSMGNAIIPGATPTLWSVIADTLLIGGVLVLVLSVISITLAALTTFTIGERIRPAAVSAR